MSRTLANQRKYFGKVADDYETKRADKPKWIQEDLTLKQLLSDWPEGTKIIDCPVGTGRFIPYYRQRNFEVVGVDVSHDMVKKARTKVGADSILFQEGNILRLSAQYAAGAFDLAIAIRIMNLIDPKDMVLALQQLQHVARRGVIFNLRVNHPETTHQHPQDMAEVEKALLPGWWISYNEPIHEHDFRMIALTKKLDLEKHDAVD